MIFNEILKGLGASRNLVQPMAFSPKQCITSKHVFEGGKTTLATITFHPDALFLNAELVLGDEILYIELGIRASLVVTRKPLPWRHRVTEEVFLMVQLPHRKNKPLILLRNYCAFTSKLGWGITTPSKNSLN